MLLLRGGVPRRNSFPTVVGEQPSSLAMALFESPCRLRYWIAPLSSRPRCCPFLRSAATVIYCVQSIVIALLLVNVVWELHSTIRVKSLWIFFSQVSNFIMQSTPKRKRTVCQIQTAGFPIQKEVSASNPLTEAGSANILRAVND